MLGIKTKMRFLSLVPVLMLMAVANADECTFITGNVSECIKSTQCQDSGNSIEIWEDCPVGEVLFSTDVTLVKDDSNCPLQLEGSFFKLNKSIDAESVIKPCFITQKPDQQLTFILALDVNEYDPQPVDGNRVSEVTFKENLLPQAVVSFTYSDEDKDETKYLQIISLSPGYDDTFNITEEPGNEETTFTLSTLRELDYETRMFYKLEYNITSTDERGLVRGTKHTVLLSVEDVGDNPPYWSETTPSAELEEGESGRWVYAVKAEDRDLDINNEVKYKLTNGSEGFFQVNETSGEVFIIKEIDFETDIRFFTLQVTAQEYIGTDLAPEPSASITITNLNILDINDNKPTFNKPSFEIEILELTDKDEVLDIDIYVNDLDSNGDFTRYTITSNNTALEVSPSDSQRNTTLELKAKKGTIFDYETTVHPIIITLTATEKANDTHSDTTTITVTLIDDNDNTPQFGKDEYLAEMKEDEGKGAEVTKVSATDKDRSEQFGTKNITYSVNCPDIGAMDVDPSGRVTLAKNNVLDFEESQEYSCTIFADDNQGEIPSNQNTSQIVITVLDVNDTPPKITVGSGTISENSAEGTEIVAEIVATDEDTDPSIQFDIDWDNSIAEKDDSQITISEEMKGWFTINPTTNSNEDTYTAKVKVGSNNPDREKAELVRLLIKATDENTEKNMNSDSEYLDITISDVNDCYPEFEGAYDAIQVTENSKAGTIFHTFETSDADENDTVTFSINDNSFIDVEQILDTFSANLIVAEGADIDREAFDQIVVTVNVTDSAAHTQSKEINIKVEDVNDNAPYFTDDVIFASFTEKDSIGKVLQIFEGNDIDLNEILVYEQGDDFEWHNGGPNPPPSVPFRVQNDEDGNANLILNFNPLGINSGYCNFTIICHDNDGIHNGTTEGKVYAITVAYQINVIYNDEVSAVQEKSQEIASVFKEVYGYPCIIDSIAKRSESETQALEEMRSFGGSPRTDGVQEQTVVMMHFIDQEKDEPVRAEVILDATSDDKIVQELNEKNAAMGLNLESVGDSFVIDDGGGQNEVLVLQILLGVVSLVLGSFLLLLLITYFLRTRNLERKLKVANTTTFGSVDSNLNRMDLSGIPGSNKFTGEGANPMYNISDADLRNDDTSSTGSGDSVLVGVEENPEFRGYLGAASTEGFTTSKGGGYENPAFNRSIDEVAAPSPFVGGTRTNPLMDAEFMGEDFDLGDPMENYNAFVRRDAGSISGNSGSSVPAENPNFSFGPN